MPINLTDVRVRLAAVPPDTVSTRALHMAYQSGAEATPRDAPALVDRVLDVSHHHPVLGAATALGLLEATQAAPSLLASAQIALGVALTRWGHFTEAAGLLEEAEQHSETYARRISLIARWHHLLCQRRITPNARVEQQIDAIAGELEAQGEASTAARCRLDISAEMFYTDRERAYATLRSARDLFHREGMVADEGYAIAMKAVLDGQLGRHEEAFAGLDEAEAIFEEISAPVLRCFVWHRRGYLYKSRLESEKALYWLEKAETLAGDLQQDYFRILSLMDIAGLQFDRGHLAEMRAANNALRQIAQASRLNWVAAFNHLSEGNLSFREGRYEQAEEAYRRAREQYERVGSPRFVALCTMNMGAAARRQGKFSMALRWLEEARQAFSDGSFAEMEVYTYHNIGVTYAAFAYFDSAIDALEQGIRIAQKRGIVLQSARPAIDLAVLLCERSDTTRAREVLRAAREYAQAGKIDQDLALCEQVEGDVFLREGQPAEALTHYRTAYEQLDALDQPELAWLAKAKVARAQVTAGDAVAASRTLTELPEGVLPTERAWRLRYLEGWIAEEQGRLPDALDAYLRALQHARPARRSLEEEAHVQEFVCVLDPIYESAFGLAIRLNQTGDALRAAELHGSQMLAARLGVNLTAGAIDTQGDRLREALRTRLGEDWTILRYAYHNEKYWLFVLTPGGLAMVPVKLDHPAARMALDLAAPPDISYRRAAYHENGSEGTFGREQRRNLFNVLLPPTVRERLHPDHTLIIVPTHELHGVAFHALLDGDVPLVERARVLYAPSLEMLLHLAEAPARTNGTRGGVIVSQSEFTQEGYSPLPHIEQEVQAVLNNTQGTLSITGEELITRADVREEVAHSDWIHVATHTFTDPSSGAFTGLLLGSSVMDIHRIRRGKLAARFVILSGCQTGLGRYYGGDEVASLAQAVLSAGAQSVIASLWLVKDENTAALMGNFYRKLGEGFSPAGALCEAQRAAHRAGMSPYYWAPFSAFGRP